VVGNKPLLASNDLSSQINTLSPQDENKTQDEIRTADESQLEEDDFNHFFIINLRNFSYTTYRSMKRASYWKFLKKKLDSYCRAFKQQSNAILELYAEYNQEYGTDHHCNMIPKFHPELNPIERCWLMVKVYVRVYCASSENVLSIVSIRRFFRTVTI
jgi:transposase